MFFMRGGILCFTFFNILVQILSLDEPFLEEDYDIVVTEWVIRNIVNNLFSTLKLGDVRQKPKLQQYSKIHNFFVSITLQDHDNLKEIARLTKVDNIDNSVQVFIAQLNEVLNEDNKSDEATDAVYITMHIEEFRNKLENLKQIYGLKSNFSHFEINKEVIKHLSSNKNDCDNSTRFKLENDTSDNLLSDTEFWQASGRRVFEGERVNIKRFPFMASVQFFKKFQCGGSVIKSDLVITSASCLQLAWNNRFFRENPAFLSVQVGSNFYEIGDENIPILEIYFHPNYNPKNLKHNLALLRLRRRLNLGAHNKKVKKINFDRNPWPLPDNTDEITIVGWGARGSNNILESQYKNQLAYAVLDFYPLRECREIYSREFVTDKNFCAGFFSKGGGACNRDAGGPGIVHGILMGVISFGSPNCGTPDAPTVFTKLGYYADWIVGIMSQKVISIRKQTTLKPEKINTFKVGSQKKPTTRRYHITPYDEEQMTGVLTPVPVKEIDKLRTLDQNSLFKEFLKTMFESEEIKEYLDQVQHEILETVRTTKSLSHKKSKTKFKSTSKSRSKPKPKPKSRPETNVNSKRKGKPRQKVKNKSKAKSKTKSKDKISTITTPKMPRATVMDTTPKTKMLSLPMPTSDKSTTKSNKKHKAVKENQISEDEKHLEHLIVSLIDNLNINDILKSKTHSSKGLHPVKKSSTPSVKDNKKKTVIKYKKNKTPKSESEELSTTRVTKGIIDEPISDDLLDISDISDISDHRKQEKSDEKRRGDDRSDNESNAAADSNGGDTNKGTDREVNNNDKDETDGEEDKNIEENKFDTEEQKNIEKDKADEEEDPSNNKDKTDTEKGKTNDKEKNSIEENKHSDEDKTDKEEYDHQYNDKTDKEEYDHNDNDKGEDKNDDRDKSKEYVSQHIKERNEEGNIFKEESNYEADSHEYKNTDVDISKETNIKDDTNKNYGTDNESNHKRSIEHENNDEDDSNEKVVSPKELSTEEDDTNEEDNSSNQTYEDEGEDDEAMSIEVNDQILSNNTEKMLDMISDSNDVYELISQALEHRL